ncbi:MAG: hypothetical protein ABJF11_19975 [Reichenbachiella sp.]|uniref:hypothetical protein n=1 Tax=Reichenbachiella sp. TaxID=2184521 RepID=UPI003263E0AA
MNKSLALTLVLDWEKQLSDFTFFDIGANKSYFAEGESSAFSVWYSKNGKTMLSQVLSSKVPTSIYFSGTFIELLVAEDSKIVLEIKSAIKNKQIEILGGTFHHSLSSLYNINHFIREAEWHKKLMKKTFGYQPEVFFNTQNIYYNELVAHLKPMGYKATFTGAIDWYLTPTQSERILCSRSNNDFKLMLISPDQGMSIFQEEMSEIQNHFVQVDYQRLLDLGGLDNIARKAKGKASFRSIRSLLEESSSEPVYNIRQPISGSYNSYNLEDLNANPLQQSWLKQLYGLESLFSTRPEKIQKRWSELSSIAYLKRLNPNFNSVDNNASYDTYQSLINMLSDLQLGL